MPYMEMQYMNKKPLILIILGGIFSVYAWHMLFKEPEKLVMKLINRENIYWEQILYIKRFIC